MSVHLAAKKGAIAETVLMPGDPLRAKWIAETFLKDAVCYNEIRGMLGFTGTFNGRGISVQGSGIGIPSAMIYYHELIHDYGVKTIIRVGTAGAYQKNLKLRDIVMAMSASTTSGINNSRFINADYSPTADFDLLMKAALYAREHNIPFRAGNVLSADEFYEENPEDYKLWARYGVLCVEMEAAGLYTIASRSNIKALAILTISDSLVNGERLSAEARENSFGQMVEIALNSA